MNKAIIAIVGISLIVVVLMIFMFYSSYQANLEAENQQAYYDAISSSSSGTGILGAGGGEDGGWISTLVGLFA
mgnify:CR=1 FL=1|jgi:hypothetical protein